jgi:hypothetical protein
MAVAVPIIMAVTAVVGTAIAVQQAQAASKANKRNAQIMEQNAVIARNDAAVQAQQIERQNILRLGAIRTAQGKAGGEASEGSVLDVLGDVAAQGELEKQNAIYQGELRARGFSNTASLDNMAADTAKTSGYLKAGSELLGGAAQAYGSYNKLNLQGSGYNTNGRDY